MCGIVGTVSKNSLSPEMRSCVRTANDALYHRGPDSDGGFDGDHIALAMRRLSIIDLAGGSQPLYNERGTVAVICNGEIYNYIELAADLRVRGHHLKTDSDVETIAHLYEDHGVDCVKFLRGMFAFALWDAEQQRLLLARDRVGEKPLYLWQDSGSLIFSSELRSLLCALPEKPQLDLAALDLFFHYQYVPEPGTPFQNVRKLPPGHRLVIEIDPWSIREERYWSMLDAPALDGDPAALVRAELETISKIVIRSDVPVGIALSGGLDSSAVALLAAPKYPETMHAFSIGYPGNLPNDERPMARQLADQLSIPFHDIEIDTGAFVSFFPALMRASDDLVADISAFPQYYVMKAAADAGVKVMLNGIGGDELFWGYDWYRKAADVNTRRAAQRRLPPLSWLDKRSANQLTFYDMEYGFAAFRPWRDRLYSSRMKDRLSPQAAFVPFTAEPPWGDIPSLLTERMFATWLVGNCISLGDRLSMASSVELRLPLADYRLAEVVIGLRKKHPDHRLAPKAWLKMALADLLPDELVNRPKRGFQPPVETWVNGLIGAYRDQVERGWLVSQGWIDRSAVSAILNAPRERWNWVIAFKLITFEIWRSEMGIAA